MTTRGRSGTRCRGRALGLHAAVGLGLTLLVPTATFAQTGVRAIDVHVDLVTDDGSAVVRVEVEFTPADSAGLRIELLGFGTATADGFRSPDPEAPLIRFDQRSGSRQWVEIGPEDLDRVGIERGDSVWHFRAVYVIRNTTMTRGETVRVHVPVLTLALPPLADAGDVFHAEVRVPSNWAVTEGFPSGLRPSSDGTFAVGLAVAPSVISLRARTDGAWRPGLPLLLDLLAVAVLAAFLIAGLRYLRTSPARNGRDGALPAPPAGARD